MIRRNFLRSIAAAVGLAPFLPALPAPQPEMSGEMRALAVLLTEQFEYMSGNLEVAGDVNHGLVGFCESFWIVDIEDKLPPRQMFLESPS